MRRTLLYTNYLIPCRLSTDPEMYDLDWLWMAWMFIIRNSIGCGQCLRPKMLSDIFCFLFTLFLPNWLLISIRIYSGIARFPCDSMAFLLTLSTVGWSLPWSCGYIQWESNIPPPCSLQTFFHKRLKILNQFLQTYYMLLSTLHYKFSFNYLQL